MGPSGTRSLLLSESLHTAARKESFGESRVLFDRILHYFPSCRGCVLRRLSLPVHLHYVTGMYVLTIRHRMLDLRGGLCRLGRMSGPTFFPEIAEWSPT